MILKESSNSFWLSVTLVVIAMLLHSAANAQQGGTASYFYDANGRLTTVLSPTGEAVIYSSNQPPFAYAQISIISPSGVVLTSSPIQNYFFTGNIIPDAAFGYIDSLVLPDTGMYTILIDPFDAVAPGLCGGTIPPYGFGATARLYDVPPNITGTITAPGLPTPVSFSTPGQNAVLTFNGVNGQRICFQGSQDIATLIGTDIKLYAPGAYPSGTPLISRVLSFSPNSFFVDPTTLTASGTYTILVDPRFNKTRTTVLTLYDVPPDITGTLTIGGQQVNINIQSVGQAALLTFNVASTQSVTVQLPDNSLSGGGGFGGSVTVSLLRSDDTVITSKTDFGPFSLAPQTLTPGTYKVKIDPDKTNTGNVGVKLTTP